MDWLLDKIQSYEAKKAVIWKDHIFSYTDLFNRVNTYFLKISGAINQGKVVAILADYSFESIAVFMALAKNKNIIVPITNSVAREIEEKLAVSGADYKIILPGNDSFEIQKIDSAEEKHSYIAQLINDRHSGLILFSSGSTGKPKAMIHDLDTLIDSFKDKKEKSLNFLIFLMFDHIGGLNTLFNSLSMGITITLPENRDPDYICSLIEKYKIDVLPASPTFLNLLLISESFNKFNLSSLKMITYGTEPMQESLLLRLKSVFPKIKFLQTFGTSETGIAHLSSKSSSSTSIKIDDPNLEYKIIEGELWLRSKTQILGYLNDSMERFTADGWFRTGDMVETESDGYIKIIGRNSEIINVGGQKVLPTEVESVLLQMPQVADCMVYGEKNALVGQIVVADIMVKNDINVSEIKKEVYKFCKEKLDNYKIPVKVNIVTKTNFNERFKKIRMKKA